VCGCLHLHTPIQFGFLQLEFEVVRKETGRKPLELLPLLAVLLLRLTVLFVTALLRLCPQPPADPAAQLEVEEVEGGAKKNK
jgi:hypothetical protein